MGPTLYIFAGLPATGKSTLARRLARHLAIPWIRIDTIEQALRDAGQIEALRHGYALAERVAADQLAMGLSAVADSVNAVRQAREGWRRCATKVGASFVDIEVVCSDAAEHRRRVETREATVPGLVLPTWAQVQARTYDPWDREPVRVDTAGCSVDEALGALLAMLG